MSIDYTRRDLLGLMGTAGAFGWTATKAQAPAPDGGVARQCRRAERRRRSQPAPVAGHRSGEPEPRQRAGSVRPALGRIGERRRRDAGRVVRPSPVGVSSGRRAARSHPARRGLSRTRAESAGQHRSADDELQFAARYRLRRPQRRDRRGDRPAPRRGGDRPHPPAVSGARRRRHGRRGRAHAQPPLGDRRPRSRRSTSSFPTRASCAGSTSGWRKASTSIATASSPSAARSPTTSSPTARWWSWPRS